MGTWRGLRAAADPARDGVRVALLRCGAGASGSRFAIRHTAPMAGPPRIVVWSDYI